jgi:hypothetical protein
MNGDTAASAEFARVMLPVAIQLLGEPNREVSTSRNPRWGTRGSLSIDPAKGTWFDNETGQGGGVLDFVMTELRVQKPDAVKWLVDHKHLENKPFQSVVQAPSAAKRGTKSLGRIVATYDYTSADGELLFQVCRFDPKDFRPRRPDGPSGWSWSLSGVERVLYRLPQLIEAIAAGRTIYIVEGEKSADRLTTMGLDATCSPGGAGKWQKSYNGNLRGARVVILPDNDPQKTHKDGTPLFHPDGRPVFAGQDHAADIAKSLHGVAAAVRVVMLPGLPLKGDVFDWLDAGGTVAELEALAPPEAEAKVEPPADANGASAVDTRAIDAVVRRFNSKFMVVNENGKAVIFQPGFDPVLERRTIDRMTFRDLSQLYMNERVFVGLDEKDRPVMKPVAEVWLRHPDRRQYVDGVVFDPKTTESKPGVLNLWSGFAVKPAPGDWSLLRSHIQAILCCSDPVRYEYLMGWLARMVQRPAEQGEVAVVMKATEGTGKGTLAKVLLKIFGQHGLAISNAKHLIGNFNSHLRDAILLFADEAFFAGDKQHVGTLKSLITEPYLTIEGKYQNAAQMPNFLHILMASNEDWVVPAGLDARRFLVLEVDESAKGNHSYFSAIWAQMEAGGYEAMLHDLLTLDIKNFNVRAVPVTQGLQVQKKFSLGTTESWWLDCLERGYVFRSKLGLEKDLAVWHPKISTELLFASYVEFAKGRSERRILSREQVGAFFAKLGATASRWRNGVVGEHLTDVENLHGGMTRKAALVRQERTYGYGLGNLDDARETFLEVTSLTIEWDGGVAPDYENRGS